MRPVVIDMCNRLRAGECERDGYSLCYSSKGFRVSVRDEFLPYYLIFNISMWVNGVNVTQVLSFREKFALKRALMAAVNLAEEKDLARKRKILEG